MRPVADRAPAMMRARRASATTGQRSGLIALGTLSLAAVAVGCSGTTGHLGLASTRPIAPDALRPAAPRQPIVGKSCIDLIVVFPMAMPNFGEAVESALQQTTGSVLTDVTIGYEIRYLPLVYGVACYVVEGDAR